MPYTVYKPPGIPVFPPHSNPAGDCVLHRLLDSGCVNASVSWPEGFAGGIAHRLDVSTSGALLVAHGLDELGAIREQFAQKRFVKTYRLRVSRDVSWDENQCDRPIAHDRRRRSRMIVQRGKSTPHRGKWLPASTCFRRVQGDVFEAEMRTGVMHQIRVHAAFLGIPLLGDSTYGGGQTPNSADAGVRFFLYHVGLSSSVFQTDPVSIPGWAAPVT